MRVRLAAMPALLVLVSNSVLGLGLGPLETQSLLNEPFDGKIKLLDVRAEDLDRLTVGLAGREQFQKAGLEFPFFLTELRFELVQPRQGADYVRVSSRQAISEPFLSFLVELNWSNGRLFKEYTVLLDPPQYSGARIAQRAPTTQPGTRVVGTAAGRRLPTAAPMPRSAPAPSRMAEGDYGPTVAGDTLWDIALQTRPSTAVSAQKMMLALLRSNPNAFINGNINLLKRGQVLRIPDDSELAGLSQSEAVAQVSQQNALWEEYRQESAASVAEEPIGAPSSRGAIAEVGEIDQAEVAATDDARLELLSAAEGEDADKVAAGGVLAEEGAGAGTEASSLTEEGLSVIQQENQELRERLTELEDVVALLQRQTQLKDNELAALQARLAAEGVEVPEFETPVDEAVPEQPTVEPQEAEVSEVLPAEETIVEDAETQLTEPVAEEAEPIPPPVSDEQVDGEADGASSLIPGGKTILLGLLAALVLGGIAVFLRLRSRRSEDVEFFEEPTFGGSEATYEAEDVVAKASGLERTLDDVHEEMESDTTPYEERFDEAGDTMGAPTASSALERTLDDVHEEMEREAREEEQQTTAELNEGIHTRPQPEEDPLEEVNVYLAYERFDQAEALIKNAIESLPDYHEYKLRLLEVYYSSNNKPAYEEAAQELYDVTGGKGPLWDSALAMWSEMSPDRALFEERTGEAEMETAPEEEPSHEVVDITAEGELDQTLDDDAQTEETSGTGKLRKTVELPGKQAEDSDIEPEDILDLSVDGSFDLPIDSEVDIPTERPEDKDSFDLEFDETADNRRGLDISLADDSLDVESSEEILDLTEETDEGVGEGIIDLVGTDGTDQDEEIIDLSETIGSSSEKSTQPLEKKNEREKGDESISHGIELEQTQDLKETNFEQTVDLQKGVGYTDSSPTFIDIGVLDGGIQLQTGVDGESSDILEPEPEPEPEPEQDAGLDEAGGLDFDISGTALAGEEGSEDAIAESEQISLSDGLDLDLDISDVDEKTVLKTAGSTSQELESNETQVSDAADQDTAPSDVFELTDILDVTDLEGFDRPTSTPQSDKASLASNDLDHLEAESPAVPDETSGAESEIAPTDAMSLDVFTSELTEVDGEIPTVPGETSGAESEIVPSDAMPLDVFTSELTEVDGEVPTVPGETSGAESEIVPSDTMSLDLPTSGSVEVDGEVPTVPGETTGTESETPPWDDISSELSLSEPTDIDGEAPTVPSEIGDAESETASFDGISPELSALEPMDMERDVPAEASEINDIVAPPDESSPELAPLEPTGSDEVYGSESVAKPLDESSIDSPTSEPAELESPGATAEASSAVSDEFVIVEDLTAEDDVVLLDLDSSTGSEPVGHVYSKESLDDADPVEAVEVKDIPAQEGLHSDTVDLEEPPAEKGLHMDTVKLPDAPAPQEETEGADLDTKLNLAKAYIELGDAESAEHMLQEVMAAGNEQQRLDAEELIKQYQH